jgi:hypothetical protein
MFQDGQVFLIPKSLQAWVKFSFSTRHCSTQSLFGAVSAEAYFSSFDLQWGRRFQNTVDFDLPCFVKS